MTIGELITWMFNKLGDFLAAIWNLPINTDALWTLGGYVFVGLFVWAMIWCFVLVREND